MLQHMQIRNFTIVKHSDINLSQGMTVITGETGAGKSILFDALHLALGGRADSKQIRAGAIRCEIAASFDITHIPSAADWLREHQLDESNECILRRIISENGRSQSYINGQICPVAQTRELAKLLVDIHGQHDNQQLLKPEKQLQALDAYGQHSELLITIKKIALDWQNLQQQRQDLLARGHDVTRLNLLQYQVQELNELSLMPNELDQLEKEFKTLDNAHNILDACAHVSQMINDNNEQSILLQINECQHKLHAFVGVSTQLQNSYDLFEQAAICMREAYNELNDYQQILEINPARTQEVEQRLQRVYDLARKHQIRPEQLTNLHAQIQVELDQFENNTTLLSALDEDIIALEKTYQTHAQQLTERRQQAAKKLEQEMIGYLQQLGLTNSRFEIEFTARNDTKPHPQGQEKVEFLISTNPGMALQSIQKAASGGELSRISLALQLINAENAATPTLLFDEVDVGIGGGTAEIVGKLLQKLGAKTQVICITHLAQVAAQGQEHLLAYKMHDDEQTHTALRLLNLEEKIQEIARMVGGVTITEKSRAHAQELLGV